MEIALANENATGINLVLKNRADYTTKVKKVRLESAMGLKSANEGLTIHQKSGKKIDQQLPNKS